MPNHTINRANAALYDHLTLHAEQLGYLATLIDLARADLADTPPHSAHCAKSVLDIAHYLIFDFENDTSLAIARLEGQA